MLLDYSTVISKLADQNTVLAQRLALLEEKFGENAASRVEPPRAAGVTNSHAIGTSRARTRDAFRVTLIAGGGW